MKSLLATLRRIIKRIMPDVQPGNINEEVEKIKHLIENTHITEEFNHYGFGGGFSGHGPYKKVTTDGKITISDARQYVTISPTMVVYGYKSKYPPYGDRHHVEIQRKPGNIWQYLDDDSNIRPTILLDFLKRYDAVMTMRGKK